MPLILAEIFVLVVIAFFISSFEQMVDIGSLQSELANQRVADLIPGAFTAIASPFVLVLWLMVFYYFLANLYDDRKDSSVLFWQSILTSQTQTIVSKLIAGLVLAPFSYHPPYCLGRHFGAFQSYCRLGCIFLQAL